MEAGKTSAKFSFISQVGALLGPIEGSEIREFKTWFQQLGIFSWHRHPDSVFFQRGRSVRANSTDSNALTLPRSALLRTVLLWIFSPFVAHQSLPSDITRSPQRNHGLHPYLQRLHLMTGLLMAIRPRFYPSAHCDALFLVSDGLF
jgi:hypothetical protein